MNDIEFKSGYSYFAHHKPTGEDWYIIGINPDVDKLCVAGWPPTIAKISDCEQFAVNKPLTDEELNYRTKKFGTYWL